MDSNNNSFIYGSLPHLPTHNIMFLECLYNIADFQVPWFNLAEGRLEKIRIYSESGDTGYVFSSSTELYRTESTGHLQIHQVPFYGTDVASLANLGLLQRIGFIQYLEPDHLGSWKSNLKLDFQLWKSLDSSHLFPCDLKKSVICKDQINYI